MTTKHTPGPWSVHILNQESERPGIEAAGISIVIYGVRDQDSEGVHGETYEQEMANARLIAAAPDGYDFAEAFLNRGKTGITIEALERMAKQFIAKAKGETL